MIQIPSLKKGDKIYILSTARKISKEELAPAIQILEKWGLEVILGKTIDAEYNQMAGDDALKIEDFTTAVEDKEIKAILCARGGYGTVRIVDQLPWNALLQKPKWIIGYSDVTTLHLHANSFGIPTIHGTMPINFKTNSKEALESLRKALFGENLTYNGVAKVFRKGEAKGELIGGNLSIIYSLLGSKSLPKMKGKILFLEDLDEYLYHIDRMMMNLKRNQIFDEINGLVIGGMTEMNDNAIPFGKTALEIIFEHIEPYEFPVIYDFPAGHLEDNRAMIMGNSIKINSSKDKGIELSFFN